MTTRTLLSSVALAAVLATLAEGSAQARIVCDGNFQIVQGLELATPYCQEANLAHVARRYGIHVSLHAIRYSESVKAEVCRAIGFDNRVRETCAPYRSDGGASGRRF